MSLLQTMNNHPYIVIAFIVKLEVVHIVLVLLLNLAYFCSLEFFSISDTEIEK